MGLFRRKQNQIVISLDIGRESVKLIKGIKKDGKICVYNFACSSYPAENMAPDQISHHIQELVSTVIGAKETTKFKIHAIIPSRKLCIRVIKLPVIPREELYEAVKSKIRHFVSNEFKKMVFSYTVLRQVQEKGINQYEVLFAALPQSVLDAYIQIFDLIQIPLKVITPVCFSGWSLIQGLNIYQKLNSIMIINMEHQETDLTVCREGRLIFTRNVPTGSRNFMDILKNQTQFSLTDPEDIKLFWDLDTEGSDAQSSENSSLMDIRSQLQSEANLLIKEIELTAHHFYQVAHGKRIDQCYILGSITQIAGLVDYLKKKLEMPINVLSIPDDQLELPSGKEGSPQWDLAMYAQALGALCVGPKDINLLTQIKSGTKRITRLFKRPQARKSLTKAAVASYLFIFLALALVAAFKGTNIYYRKKIQLYTDQRDQFRGRSMQVMQIKKKMDRLDFEKNFYTRLVKKRPSYPIIIKEIHKAMPEDSIVLDELKFYTEWSRRRSSESTRHTKFNISGKAKGRDISESEVTNFILALEQSGFFENISVSIEEMVSLQGSVTGRGQEGHFRDGELSGGELKELPFVIDGILQKDRSVVN